MSLISRFMQGIVIFNIELFLTYLTELKLINSCFSLPIKKERHIGKDRIISQPLMIYPDQLEVGRL